jgi:hypothetical protein
MQANELDPEDPTATAARVLRTAASHGYLTVDGGVVPYHAITGIFVDPENYQ